MDRIQQLLFVRFSVASAKLITANLTKEQVICFYKETLKIAEVFGDWNVEKKVCFALADVSNLSEEVQYLKQALGVTAKFDDKVGQLNAHSSLCIAYHYNLQKHEDALFHAKESMDIAKELHFEMFELSSYLMQAKIHHKMFQFDAAILKCNKCIIMAKKTGAQYIEMNAYLVLGQAYLSLQQYRHAILNCKKCIEIAKESGNMQVEMKAYLILASAYLFTNEDKDAIIYAKKSIAIAKKTNDKTTEMDAYSILATASYSLKQYENVSLYGQKCIDDFSGTTDDKCSESLFRIFSMLGKAHLRLKQYEEAILICKKGIEIAKKIGLKMMEVMAYDIQARAYLELKQYGKAIVIQKEFLEGAKSLGDTKAELDAYFILANTCVHLKRYKKAIYYCNECIKKAHETGEIQLEAEACNLIANVYHMMDKCDDGFLFEIKSFELTKGMKKQKLTMQRKCLSSGNTLFDILDQNEIPFSFLHCRNGIHQYCEIEGGLILVLNRLEAWFSYLNRELPETSNHIEKSKMELILNSLALYLITIGGTKKIACLLCESNSDNEKASQTLVEYLKNRTTGTRRNMVVFLILYGYRREQNQHDQAIECLQMVMKLELGPFYFLMNGLCHAELVHMYGKMNKNEKVIEHLYFGLNYATQCHYKHYGFIFFGHIGQWKIQQGKMNSAKYFLKEATRCSESIFKSLRQVSDLFAIKYYDKLSSSHKKLAEALILCNESQEALLVLDQCRARELKETLVTKYRMKGGITEKQEIQYTDIEHLVSTSKYSLLSFFVYSDNLHAFLVKDANGIQLTSRNVNRCKEHLMFLVRKSFDEMQVRQVVSCENRSLDATVQNAKAKCDENELGPDVRGALENESCIDFKEKSDESIDRSRATSALEGLYRELFADISYEQEDIVIIPDGPLYLVPYSALRDPDTGKYLSETKRIRIVPSISTLILLQQRRMPNQCQKSALVIGDPEIVGEVMYLGERKTFPALPFAAAEARVIASILGVKPMTRHQATKSAVIEALKQETAIIHIAAHGSIENATIVLSPSPESTAGKTITDEEDYLLTMADVQSANLRSQLVVLSCCHSGRGNISTEGVVGMCRAFLASGARAVLASLWAVSDDATLDFVSRFYFHLKQGKSASTSLQQTIKDILESKEYSDPMYWAPFLLFGDDVTIDI